MLSDYFISRPVVSNSRDDFKNGWEVAVDNGNQPYPVTAWAFAYCAS